MGKGQCYTSQFRGLTTDIWQLTITAIYIAHVLCHNAPRKTCKGSYVFCKTRTITNGIVPQMNRGLRADMSFEIHKEKYTFYPASPVCERRRPWRLAPVV